jgi:hypothetical protein
VALLAVLSAAACSSSSASGPPGEPAPERPAEPQLAAVTQPVTVLDGDAAELALGTSQALWTTAPLVAVAAVDDPDAIGEAADAAETLGVPLLLGRPGSGPSPDGGGAATEAVVATPAAAPTATPTAPVTASASAVPAPGPDPALTAELERLAAREVVAFGPHPPALDDSLEVLRDVADAEPQPVASPTTALVLAPSDPAAAAARATATAAGAEIVTVDGGDPRADAEVVEALAAAGDVPVVALGGEEFGTPERLAPLLATARTGVQLPGGGQTLFPGRRLVALYGHPGTSALGVLGEQGPEESVTRAKRLAASYEPYSEEPVVPAFEIITTVAAREAGPDGDYSNEAEIDLLRPFVDAAAEAGIYVVLDLQPGRTDFLTQARKYEELLVLPHVGLALDPEWRLGPNQRHLAQIGSVAADEVDAVADWLAALVRDRALPQKMLLLHQFRTSMIRYRETLDAERDEVAYVVQMDGHGPPGTKRETWQALLQDPPEGLWFGWKNFYDEDSPTFTPEQTMAVEPTPWWVSYQ